MDPLTLAVIALGGLYGASKLGLVNLGGTPSGLPPTAPIPVGQAATSTNAPAIAGHVIPVPPEGPSIFDDPRFASLPIAAAIPWPDATGLWRDNHGTGALHQFRGCHDEPIGQPGYMSLEYKAFLDANVQCDGRTPISGAPSGGGAGPTAAQGIQAGTAAATAAVGVASAGGAGEAGAAIATGIGAAAAALGPFPGAFSGEAMHETTIMEGRLAGHAWDRHVTHALRVAAGARLLSVNVSRVRGVYVVAAADVALSVEREPDPVSAVGQMYDDHAHAVIGGAGTLSGALLLGEAYAADWLGRVKPLDPCPCPELSPAAPAVAVPS